MSSGRFLTDRKILDSIPSKGPIGFRGAICLDLLAPCNLIHPVVPYRVKVAPFIFLDTIFCVLRGDLSFVSVEHVQLKTKT